MSTELATITAGPLAGFDPSVVDIVRGIVAPGLDDLALAFFMRDCQRRGLDPLARQAYAFRAKDGKLVTIIGIDGFRAIAEQTGQYRGRAFVEFDYGDGWTDRVGPARSLVAARVGVCREGFDQPVVATAILVEHAQRTDVWRRLTHVMLAKCAEAQALRAAFPHALSGAYAGEELPPDRDIVDAESKVVIGDCRQYHSPDENPDTDSDATLPPIPADMDPARLRVLGTTVAAIAGLAGSRQFDGLAEDEVFDRIVVPKAQRAGEAITAAFVERLIADAEERYAMMVEPSSDGPTAATPAPTQENNS